MLLTAVVDWATTVRAFAVNGLGRAHVPIPSHAKWAASSGTMSFVNGRSCTRLASELTNIHAGFVHQFCSIGTLRRLDDCAGLKLRVEDRTIATERLGDGNALPILGGRRRWAVWHGQGYASRGRDIERGSFVADWRLNVDAHTPVKLAPVLTSRDLKRGAACTGEVLTVRTHRWLQRGANIPLQYIPRATNCLSFNHTVVALEDRIVAASRRLDGDTEAIFELVSSITGWFCLEDTCLTITSTAIGTEWGTENTGLSIEFRSLRATFDVTGGWVGSRDDIVKGIFSIGALARDVLGCG